LVLDFEVYFDLAKFSLLSLGEMKRKKFDTLADLPLGVVGSDVDFLTN